MNIKCSCVLVCHCKVVLLRKKDLLITFESLNVLNGLFNKKTKQFSSVYFKGHRVQNISPLA